MDTLYQRSLAELVPALEGWLATPRRPADVVARLRADGWAGGGKRPSYGVRWRLGHDFGDRLEVYGGKGGSSRWRVRPAGEEPGSFVFRAPALAPRRRSRGPRRGGVGGAPAPRRPREASQSLLMPGPGALPCRGEAVPRRALDWSKMTLAERHEVVRRAQGGDAGAREEVVRLYGGLIYKVAARYGAHLPEADRYQAAWVGIWTKLPEWDERKGSFSTFAVWHARCGLSRWSGGASRLAATVPASVVDAVYSALIRAGKERPDWSAEEIAADDVKLAWFVREHVCDARVNVGKARAALLAGAVHAAPSSEDGSWWDGFFGAGEAEQEDARYRSELAARVRTAARGMPPRLQRIVERRLLGDGEVTLDVLGKEFGVTRERVRQLEKRALEQLRESLADLAPASAAV